MRSSTNRESSGVLSARARAQPARHGQTGSKLALSKFTRQTLDERIDEVTGPGGRGILKRLMALADDPDPKIRFQAVQLLAAYRWGRPVDRVEMAGTASGPMTAIIIEPPDAVMRRMVETARRGRQAEAIEVTAEEPAPTPAGNPPTLADVCQFERERAYGEGVKNPAQEAIPHQACEDAPGSTMSTSRAPYPSDEGDRAALPGPRASLPGSDPGR